MAMCCMCSSTSEGGHESPPRGRCGPLYAHELTPPLAPASRGWPCEGQTRGVELLTPGRDMHVATPSERFDGRGFAALAEARRKSDDTIPPGICGYTLVYG